MSDKDRAFLPRPLLRTHRAPFNAIGSSISKALLDRETRMSVTAHTSRYTCRAVARCGNGVGAPANDTTALRTVAAICLPTLDGLPPFLVTRHPLEVCPLSRGANLEPLSTRLQGGCSLPPASYTRCSVGSPHGSLSRADVHPPGGRRAYHVPLKYLRGLGLAYLPMVQRL